MGVGFSQAKSFFDFKRKNELLLPMMSLRLGLGARLGSSSGFDRDQDVESEAVHC